MENLQQYLEYQFTALIKLKGGIVLTILKWETMNAPQTDVYAKNFSEN